MTLSLLWFPFLFLSLIGGCVGRPFYPLPSKTVNQNKQPLQTFRPYNIAHRGSNGELPEETSAAYMRAIEEGTDFIETDILSTKDGALICFHDVTLDDTTDVAGHKEFANRRRTYEVQGENVTGWFTVDFTLEELKSLRVRQRYKFRDQQYNGIRDHLNSKSMCVCGSMKMLGDDLLPNKTIRETIKCILGSTTRSAFSGSSVHVQDMESACNPQPKVPTVSAATKEECATPLCENDTSIIFLICRGFALTENSTF